MLSGGGFLLRLPLPDPFAFGVAVAVLGVVVVFSSVVSGLSGRCSN